MEIELIIDGNHTCLPVKINDSSKSYNFNLDTGAKMTAIFTELAKDLNVQIDKEKSYKAKTAVGELLIQIGYLKTFTIGSSTINNLEVIISDMKKANSNVEIYGTIGHNFLKNYKVKINYPKKSFELIGKKINKEESDLMEKLVYFNDTNLVVIETMINDQGPYWFILDTGSSGNVFNASLVDELKLTPQETDKKALSPSGLIPVKEVTIEKLESKYKTQKNIQFVLINLDHFNKEGGKKMAGILGYPFLKDFEIIFDYPEQKMALLI